MPANEYGNVPQARKRIYIVAVHENLGVQYSHPEKIELTVSVDNIVDRSEQKDDYYYKSGMFLDKLRGIVNNKRVIYRMFDSTPKPLKSGICPTLTASMGMYDNSVPVLLDDYGIRMLTLRECLDFQGFPSVFSFPADVTVQEAYKQIGNSVCVPVIKRIGRQISELLSSQTITEEF